ncbi:hypothetical protein [Roseibium salinum]|uniref:Uncharacterized protein n=1 Tax=Roseibium salinum TaxID=1604349 RepID=A0ABT3R0G8_9HYPH|nr:hypothetical protein [Roseibium sp. DSM 29163]MCX2722611.1 hypothetical protein [Roseibium sp. DSM 29163]
MQKKTYYVADGVGTINGARVPSSRTVKLTDAEARYDLALERISPKKPKTGAKHSEGGEGDGAGD